VQQHGILTYHIEDADAVDVMTGTIRHQPIGTKSESVTEGWLGEARVIGITAGASTPNNKVGETIARITAVAGLDSELETALEKKA
jgi:4-hydroxy-3-methylbut-2-enyl diphosphate reductase